MNTNSTWLVTHGDIFEVLIAAQAALDKAVAAVPAIAEKGQLSEEFEDANARLQRRLVYLGQLADRGLALPAIPDEASQQHFSRACDLLSAAGAAAGSWELERTPESITAFGGICSAVSLILGRGFVELKSATDTLAAAVA